jgi:hypothetical protein
MKTVVGVIAALVTVGLAALGLRKRLNEMKNFAHKAQELRVFLRKLIQLCEVPRLLCRSRWAHAAGLRECKVGAGG